MRHCQQKYQTAQNQYMFSNQAVSQDAKRINKGPSIAFYQRPSQSQLNFLHQQSNSSENSQLIIVQSEQISNPFPRSNGLPADIQHQFKDMRLSEENGIISQIQVSQECCLQNDLCQSYKAQDQLTKLTQKVNMSDFSLLYQNKRVLRLIRFISKNKYMLPSFIRQKVKQFLDYIEARVSSFSYSNIVYRQLLNEVGNLSRAFEYNGNRRNVSPLESQTNGIYQSLVKEIQLKPHRQSELQVYRGNKISLEAYNSSISQFLKYNKWKDIIDKVTRQIQRDNFSQIMKDNPYKSNIMKKMNYSNSVYTQTVMSTGCLGCTPYFIQGWNVYDQSVNKVKLVMGGRILHFLSQNQRQGIERDIKEQICALLNSGGGVILFDCEQSYMNVLPKGQLIVKEEAKLISERIQETIIKNIYPRPKMNVNVILNIVRLMKNPFLSAKKLNLKQNSNQMFYKDLFVFRITVRPTINAIYTIIVGNLIYKLFRLKSLSKTQIDRIRVIELQDLQCDDFEAQDLFSRILNTPYSQFDHQQCNISPYNIKIEQLPDQKIILQPRCQRSQTQYQNATALVVKTEYFENLAQKLKNFNFQHVIELPFSHSNVKGAICTAILYHNIPFTQLQNMIGQNQEFQFGGRTPTLCAIGDYLKLVSRLNRNVLPRQNLKNFQRLIDFQFKEDQRCKLEIYKYENNYREIEYYLKVVGQKAIKKCTLYVFLLLNHLNEKAQLRSPNNVERVQLYRYPQI